MSSEFKTSVRIVGADEIDEFKSLGYLLGKRPHQLAAELVADGMRRYREDPDVGPRLAQATEAVTSARVRRVNAQASNVIPLHRARRNRP